MKIGFLQFEPQFGKRDKNFNTVRKLLKHATADIIVLPELFNTGYTFVDEREVADLVEPIQGETYDFMHSLAQEKKCCYAYGFAEKDKNRFYNSMALISPDGLLGVYRKTHLYFEEKNFFHPGDTGFSIFRYKNVELGMLVCYDWIYPEAMRTLAIKGAQIILHSANLVMSYCPDAMITRAVENHVFVVTADRIGREKRNNKEYRFIGQSQIVSPEGKILIRVGKEECIEVVKIDPKIALNKRVNQLNDLFRDRREELYFK